MRDYDALEMLEQAANGYWKVCTGCLVELPEEAFHTRALSKDGLMFRCTECDKKQGNKKRRKHKRDKGRAALGLPKGYYAEMLEAQGGVCWICEKPPRARQLAVDHDHDTGEIRGLLCTNCNLALGNFKDSPERLRKAIEYLEGL